MSSKESILVLLQLALGFLVKSTSSEDLLFSLNTKKVAAVTSDKFLSLTLDPALLLTGDVLASSTELSTNMAKALAPGYVRIAGPRSNAYTFERSLFPQSGYEDPDLMFSEAHWVLIQQWAQRAGLDVVSSLTPQRIENEDQTTTWDPRNSLDLISFSDHMGYNISWQLGYECQTRCDISGFDFGKDVVRLRNMLSAYPRYSNAVIAGPDIVSFRGKQQQQYIQDYLNAAGNALSAITWHPDFAGIDLDSDGVALQVDTLAADKDMLYKSMGRSASKKPLWIAESKPEECKRQFLGALVWARRLGSAAKLGVQVIMRQPDSSNMSQPTPDYWVSLLHKMLVGREVLDTKLTSGNKSHVHFYCQCTKPSAKYDRGAVTIFGINLTPGKISVSLKGLKIKAIHKYILMPGYDTDNRMFAETVLLNNEPLTLVNGKNLPEINPAVTLMGKNMAVKLPSGGIGFWVIPGARVKSCLGYDEETGDKNLLLKKLTKKLEEPEVGDENFGHELEDDNRNQELEAETTEDIKSLLKSKKKKRKYRHSDEAEDEERRFKRIDTKKELEKLEKLLKRNGNNEDKKPSHFKGRVGLAMFDNEGNESGDKIGEGNTSEEDAAGLVQFRKNEKPNSGEEIRTKLEEYKNKLIEYETRKKNDDKTVGIFTNRPFHPDQHFSTDVDTRKAVEALALISRVEGAIREYGTSGEKLQYEEEPRNSKPPTLPSDIGEEMLIEELEKPDKTKRMIDPKYLGKIYHFLLGVDNGDNKLRDKRDLEKLLGDDPLGLRKDGIFKKRLKNDEAKERRLERRHRKKDKEEIGIKKELPVGRYDPRVTDSNENNFFGFPQMKPLENFPDGDVFLNEGSSSEEKIHDYDYVKEDDDEEVLKKQQKRSKRRKTKNQRESQNVQDETRVEETNSDMRYGPNEFFEKIKFPNLAIKTEWKDHGELYEPESLQHGDFKDEQKVNENENVGDTVIVRDQTDEREDKRAKETAVKKLINYYDNSEVLRTQNKDFEREKKRPRGSKSGLKYISERPAQRKQKEEVKTEPEEEAAVERNAKRVLEMGNEYEDSEDLGSLEFVNSQAAEDYSEEMYEDEDIGAKKRTKRKIGNLDFDMFRQEMIREDAGNLKDCKCRVIRSTGKLECKNCKTHRRRQRETADSNSRETISDSDPVESLVGESTPEESLAVANEKRETSQGESVAHGIANSKETIETSSPSDGELLRKNDEVDYLNGDTRSAIFTNHENDEDYSSKVDNGDALTSEVSNPVNDDADPEIINPESNSYTDSQLISENTEGETDGEKSTDDVVGSRHLIDDGEDEDLAANQEPEEVSFDEKSVSQTGEDVEEAKNVDDIEKDVGNEDTRDDYNAKRQIPEISDVDAETESGTKISLGTGVGGGTSAKTDFFESRLKTVGDFRLKSVGLKNEPVRNKLVLNTEALSALIKESESKKAEVIKALETSAKLKSVDNAKYLEYQRKRAEKLATLKDKLRERKAKILQQYRQELLDALTKCDDEVERNLKRREIWDHFNNQEEFEEFVDKDKLAYLMTHGPVNYEDAEERDNGIVHGEDRRYYPNIDYVQSLRTPRQRRIPAADNRGYFYWPKTTQFSSSSGESFFDRGDSIGRDRSNEENGETISKINYENDEPYYAIVESLENPKIFHKKHFDEYYGIDKRHDTELGVVDSDDVGIEKEDRSVRRMYTDHRDDEKFYQPEFKYRKNDAREKHLLQDRGSGLPVYDQDLSYYNGLFGREENVLEKSYEQGVGSVDNKGYKETDDPWDSLVPEYRDGILHHKQYSRLIHPGNRQKLTGIKNPEKLGHQNRFAFDTGVKNNPDELYARGISEIPLDGGWKILQKPESPCSGGNCAGKLSFADTQELDETQGLMEDQRYGFNGGGRLVRNERHLIPHEKQVLDEPAYKIIPVNPRGDLSARRERDVKEKQSKYVCLREDSGEDFGDDEKRIFRLVRNEDHYEAVPISILPDDSGAGRQRKNHHRVAKHAEKVRNKRRKYSTDVLTDEEGNYYLKNSGYVRRNLATTKYREDRKLGGQSEAENSVENFRNKYEDDVEGRSYLTNDEIDYRLVGDEVNSLESGLKVSPEEYELLMLIPVKKHKVKRQKRELDNSIDRSESYEDMNNIWDNIADVKEHENRLQEYVDAKDKTLRDFQEARANLNNYLKKLESVQDPLQLDKFKKIVLNLGSHDQEGMAVVAKSQDELDRVHLGEYSKQEILKKIDSSGDDEAEKSTPETSSTLPTFFDIAMPKLESTINKELEKVGNLTESLEDFINEFDQRSNGTSDIKSGETGSEGPNNKKEKISYNIFHRAVNSVKKFFDFLTGVSLIFRKY